MNNMKYLLFFNLILSSQSFFCQGKSDYFVFHKDGERHLKAIRNVYFDITRNEKKNNEETIYFYIYGEVFIHNKKKHATKYYNKLKTFNFFNIKNLVADEIAYRKLKLQEDDYWKNKKVKPPFPLTEFHQYVKVFLWEKIKNEFICYAVDWTNIGGRGFKYKYQK